MGFFDTLFGGKKQSSSPVTMRVCMLGARGVGKTSVLTAMYGDMDRAVKSTNLCINADEATHTKLKNKEEELKKMFGTDVELTDDVKPGIEATAKETTFSFKLGLTTEEAALGLEIKDYPGEYLRSQPELVKGYIGESNAIILAIDTPCLMEEDGRFNESKNRVKKITEFFKETLNAESDEKLIMFVPLKCEKYYAEQRAEDVRDKVCEAYEELIEFLRDKGNSRGLQGKFAVVIAPIQTLGEVVFDDFERDGSGAVLTESIGDEDFEKILPQKTKYKYTIPGARYSPKYCEQPVVYLLSFVVKQYNKMKSGGTTGKNPFWKKMLEAFAPAPKTDEFMQEIGKLTIKKNTDKDGYKVIFGKGKA